MYFSKLLKLLWGDGVSGPVQKLLWSGGMSSPVQSSPVRSSPVQSAKLASAMSAHGKNCVPVRGSARAGVDAQWAAVIACAWCGTGERWADDDESQ